MTNWWLRFFLVLTGAAIVDKGADWALGTGAFSAPIRVLLALLPVPGNLAIIALILGRGRRLDEFQKRRHFEAVVVGFLGTGVAVFIHAYLRKAQVAGPLNAAWVWLFMAVSYLIGYLLAVRRYQ
jgi:hypothetical protein